MKTQFILYESMIPEDTVYQMFVVSSGALQQIKQGSTEEMQNIV